MTTGIGKAYQDAEKEEAKIAARLDQPWHLGFKSRGMGYGDFAVMTHDGDIVTETTGKQPADRIIDDHNATLVSTIRLTQLKMFNDVLVEAVERFLESSPCQNGCASDDMTCDTNFAENALQLVKEAESTIALKLVKGVE